MSLSPSLSKTAFVSGFQYKEEFCKAFVGENGLKRPSVQRRSRSPPSVVMIRVTYRVAGGGLFFTLLISIGTYMVGKCTTRGAKRRPTADIQSCSQAYNSIIQGMKRAVPAIAEAKAASKAAERPAKRERTQVTLYNPAAEEARHRNASGKASTPEVSWGVVPHFSILQRACPGSRPDAMPFAALYCIC